MPLTIQKTKILVVTFIYASTLFASQGHITICKKDQILCQTKCASINGHLLEVKSPSDENSIFGFMCLPAKNTYLCASDDDCKSEDEKNLRCSNLYGLLNENSRICLPFNASERLRKAGETCLVDKMCASNRCSI